MRTRIDITNVKFRVLGVGPRQVSKNDKTQKRTPRSDGERLIWTVRLNAIEETANGKTTEQIFVEVAGDMPQLVVDELATVHNLTYTPWAAVEFIDNKPKGKIMRAYRADAVTQDASARRSAA
jgi:hypothetical protein